MNGISTKFDPWGPISSVLYEIKDSDFVQTAIANTGIEIDWTPFSKADAYSHSTRIRALRRDISSAYAQIDQDTRGLVARIVVKAILRRHDGDELRASLRERLEDIGWTIDESGNLVTFDSLVSEHFFPANSEYDAYVAIRDVISNAANELIIEDPYIGTSLLMVLRTLRSNNVRVRILTVAKHLPADFAVELAAFRKQRPDIAIEIRSTADFHDRFVVADDDVYHVGASIKDAGKRAFMINLVQDQANKDKLIGSIEQSWTSAQAF
jgi:hypothetical protein